MVHIYVAYKYPNKMFKREIIFIQSIKVNSIINLKENINNYLNNHELDSFNNITSFGCCKYFFS